MKDQESALCQHGDYERDGKVSWRDTVQKPPLLPVGWIFHFLIPSIKRPIAFLKVTAFAHAHGYPHPPRARDPLCSNRQGLHSGSFDVFNSKLHLKEQVLGGCSIG